MYIHRRNENRHRCESIDLTSFTEKHVDYAGGQQYFLPNLY